MDVDQQHGELVATQPGEDPALGDVHREGLRHVPQHLVAGLVPVPVVDRLEPVQVDDQQAGRVRRGQGVGDCREQRCCAAIGEGAGDA